MVRSWASTVLGRRVWPQYLLQQSSKHTGCFHMWPSGISLPELSAGVSGTPVHRSHSRGLSAPFIATASTSTRVTSGSSCDFNETCCPIPTSVFQMSPFIPLQAWLWLSSCPESFTGCLGEGTVMIALQNFGVPSERDPVGFPVAESQMASEPLKSKIPQEANACWQHHPEENSHPHLVVIAETNEKIDLGKSIQSRQR